jgi:nucleoside-diphosphate-sugar epimerase
MSTYLITGGAGFIGSHVADRLVERGDRVLVLDDLSGGSVGNLAHAASQGDRVRLLEGSVLDAELVGRCMREADVCLHLAAALGVKRIVDQPLETLLANVRGTDIVMAAANRLGRRLLFASSSEVYGKRTAEGLREDADCTIGAPARSRWSYAIGKQFGESLAHAYTQDAGADIITVRLFNVVGPRQSRAYGMVLPRFVAQAIAGKPLTIYGDGTQSRCFTSVHDVVNAVEGLLGSNSAGGATYNVGASKSIRIDELACRVIDRAGSPSCIVQIPYAQAYGAGYEELGSRVPDTSALRGCTGWEPLRGIEQMIDEVIESQRAAARRLVRLPAARSRRRRPTAIARGA